VRRKMDMTQLFSVIILKIIIKTSKNAFIFRLDFRLKKNVYLYIIHITFNFYLKKLNLSILLLNVLIQNDFSKLFYEQMFFYNQKSSTRKKQKYKIFASFELLFRFLTKSRACELFFFFMSEKIIVYSNYTKIYNNMRLDGSL
jgi:hypothetical protein